MDKLSDRLSALAEKATKGPWAVGGQIGAPAPHIVDMGKPPKAPFLRLHEGRSGFNNYAVAHTDGPLDERDASVRLIVELVNNLPTIISALQEKDM